VIAISELTATNAAPEHHEFVQASILTDLPNEIMSALSQGLSQFGINLPPLPTLSGTSGLNQPISASPLTAPGLSPLTSPSPLTVPGLSTAPAAAPLTGTALTDPALTPANSALTPLGTTAAIPGLTIPPAATPDASLTAPGALPATTPGLGLPTEFPISTPVEGDPAALYPILGGSSIAPAPASTGGGGLISDLSSAAQQLGVGQVVDLIKGMVMPSIQSAVQAAAPAAAAAVTPAG
jgi:hypothetical protein